MELMLSAAWSTADGQANPRWHSSAFTDVKQIHCFQVCLSFYLTSCVPEGNSFFCSCLWLVLCVTSTRWDYSILNPTCWSSFSFCNLHKHQHPTKTPFWHSIAFRVSVKLTGELNFSCNEAQDVAGANWKNKNSKNRNREKNQLCRSNGFVSLATGYEVF